MKANLATTGNEILESCHKTLSCEWFCTSRRSLLFRDLLGKTEAAAFGLPDAGVGMFEVLAKG